MKITTKIPESPAIELIAQDRKRQIIEEGFTVASDMAMNPNGELAAAAACYAWPKHLHSSQDDGIFKFWPWEAKWYKPSPNDRKREIIKAAALLVAEWDRLDAEESK
jgi:hypothetical protein